MNGIVVLQNEEHCGYWASNIKEFYPNPFYIKLCKNLWSEFTEFLVVSEAWSDEY